MLEVGPAAWRKWRLYGEELTDMGVRAFVAPPPCLGVGATCAHHPSDCDLPLAAGVTNASRRQDRRRRALPSLRRRETQSLHETRARARCRVCRTGGPRRHLAVAHLQLLNFCTPQAPTDRRVPRARCLSLWGLDRGKNIGPVHRYVVPQPQTLRSPALLDDRRKSRLDR